MSSDKLRIVIVDNKRDRRSQIANALPRYAEAIECDFGDRAKTIIRTAVDGRLPDLVIIDGNDSKGGELYRWMKVGDSYLAHKFIPILVLTEDEFSEEAMDFLEYGDVVFYEGDFDEDEFYSAFIEAIETQAPEEEKDNQIPYESDKNPERIMGRTIKAPSVPEDKNHRSAILTPEERLKNLAAALERGRIRAEEIRVLQAEMLGQKYVRKYTAHLVGADGEYISSANGKSNPVLGVSKPIKSQLPWESSMVDEDDIPEEFRVVKKTAEPSKNSNIIRNTHDFKPTTPVNSAKGKGVIVVVDDHDFVRRMFEMTLSDKYTVVSIPSGMKAVDYFVNNTADLIFLDAVMPGLIGAQALKSIRWQVNGQTVPCIFLVGNDYRGSMDEFKRDYVCGTLRKPVSKGMILSAVEQVKAFIPNLK